jgi:hypothetical protein
VLGITGVRCRKCRGDRARRSCVSQLRHGKS